MPEVDWPPWGPQPVEGFKVVRVEVIESDVTLEAEGDAGQWFRLGTGGPGGPVRISRPDGSNVTRDNQTWETEILSWQNDDVESLTVDRESNLALRLRTGWSIAIAPAPDVETWELFTPSGAQFAEPYDRRG
jgi:hypothetical protein